jgi:erythromycin esterase-like protein
MTVPTPLVSVRAADRRALGDAVAARLAHLPHQPRLLGFGEPTHGEDEFARLRDAVFAALVDRAGFTTIALETSAWHGRVVDAYVRGADGVEDDVMAAGFTHGFGGSAANRLLVRWLREQNRHRPAAQHLRFAGFDAPVEMMWAPSPRDPLRTLHAFVAPHADVPAWETIDGLLGAEEPWRDEAAAMDAARSVGGEPRVVTLRAITDDLCRLLAGEAPLLRHESGFEDAALAGRTAAGLLAYHATMARDTGDRWGRIGSIRDAMMAENLLALADRGPTLVFAHNQHLRSGALSMTLGPMTVRWLPAGAHLVDRLGDDYRVIACAVGDAPHLDIAEPEPGSVEGALHRALPSGNHLLPAPELRHLHRRTRSADFRYIPIDDTLLGEVDEVLFVRSVTG